MDKQLKQGRIHGIRCYETPFSAVKEKALRTYERADGRMDGRTDRRTDGRTDGRTDIQTDGHTDGGTYPVIESLARD